MKSIYLCRTYNITNDCNTNTQSHFPFVRALGTSKINYTHHIKYNFISAKHNNNSSLFQCTQTHGRRLMSKKRITNYQNWRGVFMCRSKEYREWEPLIKVLFERKNYRISYTLGIIIIKSSKKNHSKNCDSEQKSFYNFILFFRSLFYCAVIIFWSVVVEKQTK